MLETAWQYPAHPKALWKGSSNCVMRLFGMVSKIVYEASRVTVYNKEIVGNLVDHRKRGLVTYCNHTSCIDDPFLWGMLTTRKILTPHKIRWSLVADNICYTRVSHARFFWLGKGIPICRGDGVYQRGMDFAIDRLNNHEWVHIFPEGIVNVAREKMRMKWGIGRLVAEAEETPMVVPLYHIGIDNIYPYKPPLKYMVYPLQKITVVVGKPIDFSDDVKRLKDENKSASEIRKFITDRVQEKFYELKDEAESYHFKDDNNNKPS